MFKPTFVSEPTVSCVLVTYLEGQTLKKELAERHGEDRIVVAKRAIFRFSIRPMISIPSSSHAPQLQPAKSNTFKHHFESETAYMVQLNTALDIEFVRTSLLAG